MKRIFCLLMSFILVFCFSGCSGTDSKLEKHLELDFPDITEISEKDTHGGFHGDGELFIKIKFKDNSLEEQLKEWKQFPLTENLEKAVYGCTENIGEDEEITFASLFSDENGISKIPQIENGYYYFYDRYSESTDPEDDSELFSRYSWNFSLAIYDCDNSTLYYMELDT